MYATTAGRGLPRAVGVVLVVILAAVAGSAVGTVLREELRAQPGAPIAAGTTRTATAAFSLDAIGDLQALRGDPPAAADRAWLPTSGQRKAADAALDWRERPVPQTVHRPR